MTLVRGNPLEQRGQKASEPGGSGILMLDSVRRLLDGIVGQVDSISELIELELANRGHGGVDLLSTKV